MQPPPITKLQTIDAKETRNQIKRLHRVRDQRDNVTLRSALLRLKSVAQDSDNTFPAILECVESYATVGEIADTFRDVFGEQREFVNF